MELNRSNLTKTAVWTVGVLSAGYLAYRFIASRRIHLDQSVGEKLPISKNLATIPDDQGNYDIDGVSYDVEGTIVSGDNSKVASAQIN